MTIVADHLAECPYCGNIYFIPEMDLIVGLRLNEDEVWPSTPYFTDPDRYCRDCCWYNEFRWRVPWCDLHSKRTDWDMTCEQFEASKQDYFYKGGVGFRTYPYATVYPKDDDFDTVQLLPPNMGEAEGGRCSPECKHYRKRIFGKDRCALVDTWDVGSKVFCSGFERRGK